MKRSNPRSNGRALSTFTSTGSAGPPFTTTLARYRNEHGSANSHRGSFSVCGGPAISEVHSEVFEKLRQLSGQLYADMALIPSYPVFGSIFFLPRREKVYESAQNLIAVANWMNSKSDRKFDHIVRNIQKACDNLDLYIAPADRIPEELSQK